jgi:hypothetical protein
VFDGGIGAGWEHERLPARDVLQQQLAQLGGYLFPAGDGTFKCHKYTIDAVSQFDFTQSHICASFDDDGRPVSSLHIELSRMELVHNTFAIHYNYHAGKQKYDSVVYASAGGCNHSAAGTAEQLVGLCQDSSDRYGTLPPLEIFANWISDTPTAEALLQHVVEYFWSQHIFVTFDTVFVALHLEVADFCTITHPDLPPLDTGQAFEVLGLRYRFPREAAPTITVTAARVLNKSIDGFRLRDDDGTLWRLAVDRSGALGFFPDSTETPYPGRVFRILNPDTVYDYLQVEDQFAALRYLSLVTTGGLTEWRIHDAAPGGTGYLVPLLLLGQDSQQYVIGAESFPDGTAELVVYPVGRRTVVQGYDLKEDGGGPQYTVFVNRAGALQIFLASDPFPLAGLAFERIGPDPAPNFLIFPDELGGTQYVRIVTRGGTVGLEVSPTLPSGTGETIGALFLRGASLAVYRITARSREVLNVQEIT